MASLLVASLCAPLSPGVPVMASSSCSASPSLLLGVRTRSSSWDNSTAEVADQAVDKALVRQRFG
eukprot:1025546-Prymnesium_polylepis.2